MEEFKTWFLVGFDHILNVAALDHILFVFSARSCIQTKYDKADCYTYNSLYHWSLNNTNYICFRFNNI